MLQLVLDGSVMVGEGSMLNVLDVETIRRRVLLRAIGTGCIPEHAQKVHFSSRRKARRV